MPYILCNDVAYEVYHVVYEKYVICVYMLVCTPDRHIHYFTRSCYFVSQKCDCSAHDVCLSIYHLFVCNSVVGLVKCASPILYIN